MNKRDLAKLDGLLLMLTAHFNDPLHQSVVIGRGEARAIVAVIREMRNDRLTGENARETT